MEKALPRDTLNHTYSVHTHAQDSAENVVLKVPNYTAPISKSQTHQKKERTDYGCHELEIATVLSSLL